MDLSYHFYLIGYSANKQDCTINGHVVQFYKNKLYNINEENLLCLKKDCFNWVSDQFPLKKFLYKDVVVMSISYLGFMTQEEYKANKD